MKCKSSSGAFAIAYALLKAISLFWLNRWLIWMYKLALCDGKASYFFKLHPSYSETSAGAFTSLLCCMHKFNMFCSTKAKKNF